MTPQVHTSHCSLTKSVTEALRWKPESKMVIAIDAKGKGKKKKGGKKKDKILWNYSLAMGCWTLQKVL